MSEGLETVERSHSGLFILLVVFATFASAGALIWSFTLQSRLGKAESALASARQQRDALAASLNETDARLRVTSESVGLTQRQLQTKANQLLQQQAAASSRLEHEQTVAREESQKQIGAVSGEVSSVKSDVGGVKTDVAQTKTELQSDEAKLQAMTGDLGVQGGLIATNGKELEILKHKGDRNYYQFTLHKGARPTILAGVNLQLRKADPKHSRYTMTVIADDRKIEKKNKQMNEPVQFYTGKDNLLYEVVVNTVNKNEVVGYLATPKQPSSAEKP